MASISETMALALQHQSMGNFQMAEQLFRQVLRAVPSQVNAQNCLGVALAQQGKLAQAEVSFRTTLEIQPDNVEAHYNLGLLFTQQMKYEQASHYYHQALRLRPTFAEACTNLAIVLEELGMLEEAIAWYRQALQLLPHQPRAYFNLANALQKHDRHIEAIHLYHQALRLDPNFAEALNNLAIAFKSQNKLDEAVGSCQHALRLKPSLAEAHNNLGTILELLGKPEDALRSYHQSLRLQPNYVEAHVNLGNLLERQDKLEEAILCYRQALQHRPTYAEAHNNLGIVFKRQGKLDEAIRNCQEALRLKPNFAKAHNNFGFALHAQGKLDEALTQYELALKLEPNDPQARLNRSMLWLLRGDFEKGWQDYEYRWLQPHGPRHAYAAPLWDGSDLGGRTVLLHAEQGLGDTIQFVRYAALIKERGGRVVVQCPPSLMSLMAHVAGVDLSVADDLSAGPPAFDVQAPLMSLPGIFQTTLGTIPAKIPYLRADAGLLERWREDLKPKKGLRIGIAWQGRPTHREDHLRSIPFAYFAKLAKDFGGQWISLQKGPGSEQLRGVAGLFDVQDVSNRVEDFMDTAAVICNLDLVISADTSVAHLAGALGVPVWVALQMVPDWRWLLGREDSPWYPTMRLFRQTQHGDWEGVFGRMANELKVIGGKVRPL